MVQWKKNKSQVKNVKPDVRFPEGYSGAELTKNIGQAKLRFTVRVQKYSDQQKVDYPKIYKLCCERKYNDAYNATQNRIVVDRKTDSFKVLLESLNAVFALDWVDTNMLEKSRLTPEIFQSCLKICYMAVKLPVDESMELVTVCHHIFLLLGLEFKMKVSENPRGYIDSPKYVSNMEDLPEKQVVIEYMQQIYKLFSEGEELEMPSSMSNKSILTKSEKAIESSTKFTSPPPVEDKKPEEIQQPEPIVEIPSIPMDVAPPQPQLPPPQPQQIAETISLEKIYQKISGLTSLTTTDIMNSIRDSNSKVN